MVRQHRGARGGERSDQSGESIFTMGSFFDRNIVFWSSIAFIYLRQE